MPPVPEPTSPDHWLNRPLAIIGMACRLPHADGLDAFWRLLKTGGYAVERMPDSKLDRELYFHPEKGKRGKTYSDVGGFVSQRELNWDLLPLSKSEAADWDECHLNLCEVAAQACQNAGFDWEGIPNRRVGVFVGHSGGSTLGGELAFRAMAGKHVALLDELSKLAAGESIDWALAKEQLLNKMRAGRPQRQGGRPWVEASFAAGLISQAFGFDGPFMSVEAACASSLVALALGANALHSGDIDAALIGGASFNKTDSLVLFSKAQSCSANASRPFDQNADGLISSEGYVSVLVKTLEKAEQDGDRIHAVIRGIGVASDGRGRSLWAPRKEGQLTAIERAYSGGVSPATVQLVEAHATSTQVGDATEMEALAAFYGEHLPRGVRLPVGSVKSNIGHTLETAGLAGLVKSILAIQNQTIPPTVNVETPSTSIPWDEIPLYPVTEAIPWELANAGQPRRAAVNAFGIGGLNVHLVVDEYVRAKNSDLLTQSSPHAARIGDTVRQVSVKRGTESDLPPGPVAVIGRGLVVPGANNLAQFAKLCDSVVSGRPAFAGNHQRQSGEFSGGAADHLVRVTDFEYDWRRHKVPPKQISQANPLQFMLLDAAEQALDESGVLGRGFRRQNAAVVVGSSFGGDFGNSLFVGLRLPEIESHLRGILSAQSQDRALVESLVEHFVGVFCKAEPAILDETGSFTSSTLASRLSKTFDLMGGAMAIDAGDASGSAAIASAVGLLNSGSVETVLCAAAQRALDQAAVENLVQLGRLRDSKQPGQGYAVGEGVGLLLLKRLDQARKDGDPIFATITDSQQSTLPLASVHGEGLPTDAPEWRRLPNLERAVAVGAVGIDAIDAKLRAAMNCDELKKSPWIERTGHLQAAQPIVDLIAATQPHLVSSFPDRLAIIDHSTGGQVYATQIRVGAAITDDQDRPPKTTASLSETSKVQAQTGKRAKVSSNVEPMRTFEVLRLEATDVEGLRRKVEQFANEDLPQRECLRRFTASKGWRASLVFEADQRRRLASLAGQIGNESARVPLAEQGVLWTSTQELGRGPNRVAWAFPGQGSQYIGMLRELIEGDPVASSVMQRVDDALEQVLVCQGQEPIRFSRLAWDAQSEMGDDIWQTQAAMLAADWIVMQVLRERGLRPDLVFGHSFGEFPAMLAAGCWNLEEALQATWYRCHAVATHAVRDQAMLSIQAESDSVRYSLRNWDGQIAISHRNAPSQTVVGGRRSAIASLAQQLEEEEVPSRLLAVPTAFHTPALEAAVEPFRASLSQIGMVPPRIPLLSNITNRYEADPHSIRENLAKQLSSPLDFVGVAQCLERDRVGLVIEVGPQQILTKLLRQTSPTLRVVATDHKTRPAMQLELALAQAELLSTDETTSLGTSRARIQSGVKPVHFDATQPRKARLKAERLSTKDVSVRLEARNTAAPIHHDATEERRRVARLSAGTVANESSEKGAFETAARVPSPQSNIAATGEGARVNQRVEAAKSQKDIQQFLIDFVVEQTGYPAEIIELDWDLEADLGIDSIKKAQLFGELREFFDLESRRDLKLDDYRTLDQIVSLLASTPGKGEWLSVDPEPVADTSGSVDVTPLVAPQSAGVDAMLPIDAEAEFVAANRSQTELAQLLVDFVVEQTGYPPEVVELDADLEADLGIDSIKKAQLLGEMRELFPGEMDHAGASGMNTGQAPGAGQGGRNSDGLRTLQDILSALAPSETLARSAVSLEAVSPVEETSAPGSSVGVGEVGMVQPNKVIAAPESFDALPSNDLSQPTPTPSHPPLAASFEAPCSRARDNLEAFVARVEPGGNEICRVLGELQSGYLSKTESRAAELKVSSETVRAFDRWLYCNASMCELPSDPSSVCWLAAWEIPAVVASNSQGPLLERSVGEPSDLIGVPGGCLPFAVVSKAAQVVFWSVDPSVVSWDDYVRLVCSISEAVGLAKEAPLQGLVRQLKDCIEQSGVACVVKVADLGERSIAELISYRQTVVGSTRDMEPGVTSNPNLELGHHGRKRDFSEVRVGFDPTSKRIVIHGGMTDTCEIREDTNSTLKAIEEELHDASLELAAAKQRGDVTTRYELQMAPSRGHDVEGARKQPAWFGRALVVGDNAVATQLIARMNSVGVECFHLSSSNELAYRFAGLIEEAPVPHLFITSPLDENARSELSSSSWQERREPGLTNLFWLCQRWHQHVLESGFAYEASLVATTSLGGDFGLSGNVQSIEGGGLAGLLKSISIESWTQGIRPLAIKILDTHPQQSASDIVAGIWHELAYPSYDTEVSFASGVRQVIRALPRPLPPGDSSRVKAGGNWICTGGARGITAYVAERLAERYGLTVHLLGKSPQPEMDPAWRDLSADELKQLKIEVMTRARDLGKNPVKEWQCTEKALEIDATVRRLRSLGVTAHYHCCDVSSAASLEKVLQRVRKMSGPIDAVLHGAGVGKDSRFDRKQREKVDECIAAKVDGAIALMEATWQDPLQFFIGFGSISGRFGANGHTDYSLANEMLCKQIDWFQQRRPEVRAVGFHWHAWGDVGMATKPETKLALEMIDMQFMPAREGLHHLVRELESDSNATEVLITDDRYFRMFFPSETVIADGGKNGNHHGDNSMALLTKCSGDGPGYTYSAVVDPNRDLFLSDHLLGQRPLLPFVVAAEFFHEAGRDYYGADRVQIENIEAVTPLRFFGDEERALEVKLSSDDSESGTRFELRSDFHSRNGTLVEAGRVHFRANVAGDERAGIDGSTRLQRPADTAWKKAVYPDADSEFYVGWSLQKLRRYLLGEKSIIGWISAPAIVELAGNWRNTAGWRVPSAALDSCLFTAGILAWNRVSTGSALPVRMERLSIGRLPDPGEACEVHVQLQESFTRTDGHLGARFNFTLYGINNEPLVDVLGYEVAWVGTAGDRSVSNTGARVSRSSELPES